MRRTQYTGYVRKGLKLTIIPHNLIDLPSGGSNSFRDRDRPKQISVARFPRVVK